MKHILTAEEIEARDARRARFQGLVKRIAVMSDSERAAFSASMPCVVTCEGHALSPINTMLVMMQSGSIAPSIVGGFHQWRKQGRSVQKGQHGFSIWIPSKGKKQEGLDSGDEGEARETYFFMGTVFDISQTQENEAKKAA